MAEGVPVIASRCGGLQETIEDVKFGLLLGLSLDQWGFSSVNPEELADCITMLVDNQQLADRYAEMGRRRVAESFGTAQMVAETYRAYQDVQTAFTARQNAGFAQVTADPPFPKAIPASIHAVQFRGQTRNSLAPINLGEPLLLGGRRQRAP